MIRKGWQFLTGKRLQLAGLKQGSGPKRWSVHSSNSKETRARRRVGLGGKKREGETASLPGVAGCFPEGLRQGPSQSWCKMAETTGNLLEAADDLLVYCPVCFLLFPWPSSSVSVQPAAADLLLQPLTCSTLTPASHGLIKLQYLPLIHFLVPSVLTTP